MTVKTSFIKALCGSCSGVGIFQRLRHQSFWRSFLHLLLLAFICSAVIVFCENRRIAPQFENAANRFIGSFGGIEISSEGMSPELSPGRARQVYLLDNWLVVYQSDVSSRWHLPEVSRLFDLSALTLWSPKQLIVAVRNGQSWWVLENGSKATTCDSDAKLYEMFDGKPIDHDSWPQMQSIKVPGSELFDFASGVSVLWRFVFYWLRLFFMAVFYISLFMLIFLLFGGRRMPNITPREYYKMGIYAGFPAMLIAGSFPALDLPYLSYETVFVIVQMGYWMFVGAVAERDIAQKGDEHNEK